VPLSDESAAGAALARVRSNFVGGTRGRKGPYARPSRTSWRHSFTTAVGTPICLHKLTGWGQWWNMPLGALGGSTKSEASGRTPVLSWRYTIVSASVGLARAGVDARSAALKTLVVTTSRVGRTPASSASDLFIGPTPKKSHSRLIPRIRRATASISRRPRRKSKPVVGTRSGPGSARCAHTAMDAQAPRALATKTLILHLGLTSRATKSGTAKERSRAF
jgi:hypothetical protein